MTSEQFEEHFRNHPFKEIEQTSFSNFWTEDENGTVSFGLKGEKIGEDISLPIITDFENRPLEYDLLFENVELNGKLSIGESHGAEVENECVLGRLEIRDSTLREMVTQGISTSVFKLLNTTCTTFSLKQSQIRDRVEIFNSGLQESKFIFSDIACAALNIENCNIHEVILNQGVNKTNILSNIILKDSSANRLMMDDIIIESLRFMKCQFAQVLLSKLKSSKEGFNIDINSSRLEEVTLKNIDNLSRIAFKKSRLLNEGEVTFENINVNEMVLEEFTNDGIVHFIKVRWKKNQKNTLSLQILKSFLGRTIFNDSDLDALESVTILNSDVSNVSFLGKNHFPLDKINNNIPSDWRGDLLYQDRLVFSQLKKSFEKRGSRIEYNRYYAWEMRAFKNSLNIRKVSNWPERLLLNFNQWSNSFDQNWIQAFVLVLFNGFFWFFWYCIAISGFPDGWHLFLQQAERLPEFIFPTHSWQFFEQSTTKGWAFAIDGLSRITTSYLIYQTIQAFRAHGKK